MFRTENETSQDVMTGAEIIVRALEDNAVSHVFGYPGGSVLPIYDEMARHPRLRHVLVRHEQGAGHAAEGYARSTGKVGVVLVTSGPGVTNMITPLQDAMMDSVPIVCITGQVPTRLIGTDAFQECDTVGLTRPCTKHNWLVTDVGQLARTIHEAFRVARSGRPGPVVIDVPKDVQLAVGAYQSPTSMSASGRPAATQASRSHSIAEAVALMASARRPLLYTGGGVVNSGPEASALLRRFAALSGFPVTSTLMGLGAYPASGDRWLGMPGLHGSYEANMAMHGCDVMVCIGARFDDRVTGRLDGFSPGSRKIHIDIDASSINKIVPVDIALRGDAAAVLGEFLAAWEALPAPPMRERLVEWWQTLGQWRSRRSFAYVHKVGEIMPQYAIERLHALTRDRDTFITTEVGQHQMWAAQYYGFEKPNRLMTSGGLGTMGYGLPAAIGVQIANPDSLVIDIAGDASIQMCIQELSTAIQHDAPVKAFILNNQYMGMVRQWQMLMHGNRLSHSYTEAMPDFVKLAEAYGAVGIRCSDPDELDDAITEMISIRRPVVFDCRIVDLANCFPMIPSGNAHNEMLLADEADEQTVATAIPAAGRGMV